MEKIYNFGESNNLMGILNQPAEFKSNDKPVILILNAGLVNKSGPFRMSTELSRFIASQGVASFRFDLSGIGDSEKPLQDTRSYKERNLDDIRQAVEFLKAQGITNIITLGLCTGADLAYRAAAKFSEIKGCVLLDGYGYPTRKFYFYRYITQLFKLQSYIKFYCKVVDMFSFIKSCNEPEDDMDSYFWELPKKEDYIASMKMMHQNGVQQFYIFTGGAYDYYNYKEQFTEEFGNYDFAKSVRVEFFKEADHTYILGAHRVKLFDLIMDWYHLHYN